MPYSPCFRPMACCNSCTWKPRTKGHSWHRSIYMWKRYLHYRGQEIFGHSGKKRTRKWCTFKDCHRMDRCSLRRSYFVIRSPCRTQKYSNCSRRARESKKILPACARRPGVPSNSALSRTFWPWKSKNIIRRYFSHKFLNRLALPFEGNSRDYVAYRH